LKDVRALFAPRVVYDEASGVAVGPTLWFWDGAVVPNAVLADAEGGLKPFVWAAAAGGGGTPKGLDVDCCCC